MIALTKNKGCLGPNQNTIEMALASLRGELPTRQRLSNEHKSFINIFLYNLAQNSLLSLGRQVTARIK